MIRRMERLCGYARKVSTVIELAININVHGSCTQSLSIRVIPIALKQPHVTEFGFLGMQRADTRGLKVSVSPNINPLISQATPFYQ